MRSSFCIRYFPGFWGAIFLGLLFLSPGCSNYLGGKEDKPEVIQFADPKLECLKIFPENIRKYVLNDLSAEQTRGTITCVQEAAMLFQQKTKGSGGDTYKTDELRRFFEKYFSKETTVSKELAQELMRFKKALVGGAEDVISKSEITQLIKVLEIVKEEAVRLQPSIRVLFLQEKTATLEEINRTSEALRQSAMRFVKEVDLANSEYTFEDAKYLLSLFAEYISGGRQVRQFGQVKSLMPLIESLRKLLIGESVRLRGDIEYNRAINNFVDAHHIFLGIYYRLRFFDFKSSSDVEEVGRFVEKGIILLGNSHQFQSQREVTFASIDQFLIALQERELIPKKISAAALQDVYKSMVARNLDPSRHGDVRGLKSIQKIHLDSLLYEFHMWSMKQKWIGSLQYNQQGLIALDDLIQQAKGLDVKAWLAKMNISESSEINYLKVAWNEFIRIISSHRAVAFDGEGRFIIDFDTRRYPQSWKNLTQGNIVHLFTRGLMQGFAANSEMSNFDRYMTGATFSDWYREYTLLGVELKAFDTRSKNAGERSLLEANLFTKWGNGDARMDFNETYDFLSLLISGGIFVVNQVHEVMADQQCLLGDLDIFGFPWINEDCFKKAIRENAMKLFANLPHMARYLTQLSATQFESFYEDLMVAARISARQGKLETADIRTFVMMLHYAENLAIQFDQNRDGQLSASELIQNAPRFFPLMKEIKKGQWPHAVIEKSPDNFWQEVFLYLVVQGEIPDSLSKFGAFEAKRFWNSDWIRNKSDQKFKANRSSIVRVFRLIKEK